VSSRAAGRLSDYHYRHKSVIPPRSTERLLFKTLVQEKQHAQGLREPHPE
jgi:hypothetical protein